MAPFYVCRSDDCQGPDASTVPGAMYVVQSGAVVPGTVTVSGSGRTIVFTPNTPFALGIVVEIQVTAGATDAGRNPLLPYYGTFTIASDPTTTAPTVVQISPGQGTTNNPLNSRVDLEFSEPLNPTTVTSSTFGICSGTETRLPEACH